MNLSYYYDSICKQPFLSRDEEEALFKVVQDTTGLYSDKEKSAARDRIITANLRFVFQKAKEKSKSDPEMFEVLIAAGNEGLLKAFRKFSPDRGIRFLTYAGWWVLQTQLKEMSLMRIVALPIWKQQLAAKIARIQLDSEDQVPIDKLCEMFPEHSRSVIEELYSTKYLTYYFEDFMEDNSTFEEEYASYLHEDSEDLLALCMKLPHPCGMILIMYFGLNDGVRRGTKYMAASLGISVDEVKKAKKKGLAILHKLLC